MIKVKTARKLDEITRYQKETGKRHSVLDEFEQYVSKSQPAAYAFTMIEIPKIGINPGTNYETPAGVYFYPLDEKHFKQLIGDTLPFVSDKLYVGLVKIKGLDSGRWLKFWNKGVDHQSNDKVREFANSLRSPGKTMMEAKSGGKHWEFNNDAKIFDLGYFATRYEDRSTVKWNSLLRKAGYIGLYDMGNEIVHESEPWQVVALSPEAYETVGVFETRDLRKGEAQVKAGALRELQVAEVTKDDDFLRKMAGTGNMPMRMAVSRNPNCPEDILDELSRDQAWMVRMVVAGNPKTPPKTLLLMTKPNNAETYHVLKPLAGNPNMPEQGLLDLATRVGHMPNISANILSNQNTTPNVLDALARSSGDAETQYKIIKNPNTMNDTLVFLTEDGNSPYIQKMATQELKERGRNG